MEENESVRKSNKGLVMWEESQENVELVKLSGRRSG